MSILITGGAGFIGSHVLMELAASSERVVVLDNFSNSSPESVRRVEEFLGVSISLIFGDVSDQSVVERVLREWEVGSVIHLAGLKSVSRSLVCPISYYENNVKASISLFRAMHSCGVRKLVFSSSATVYKLPAELPLREDSALGTCSSPYGRSKRMVERMLQDLSKSDSKWSIAILRYFNPIGAHQSGRIGEDPKGVPDNLMPYIARVALGRLNKLIVHGGDYPTLDGTGVRDYLHVSDLAVGHVKALEYLEVHPGYHVWNLGTGTGHSVLQVVDAFERMSGQQISVEISTRRAGDVAACWADASKAWRELGWRAERTLDQMVLDTWRWQAGNPDGYL